MRVFFHRFLYGLVIIGLFFSPNLDIFHPSLPFYSIAHRGASAHAPENTMSAFNKAYELGYDYIELDVRISKDEQLVVIHDKLVNRTTDGEGYVHDFTVEELKQLDAGSWFDPKFSEEKIPLLIEVIKTFGGKLGLLIELKKDHNEETMVKQLSIMLKSFFDEGLDPSMVKVQSFDLNMIKSFHKLCPDISVGLVLFKPLSFFHQFVYHDIISFLSIHDQFLSKSFFNQAKFFHYEIYVWTSNNPEHILFSTKNLIQGIITNHKPYISAC